MRGSNEELVNQILIDADNQQQQGMGCNIVALHEHQVRNLEISEMLIAYKCVFYEKNGAGKGELIRTMYNIYIQNFYDNAYLYAKLKNQ